MEKICIKCNLTKKLEEFTFNKSKQNYFDRCRKCTNEYKRNLPSTKARNQRLKEFYVDNKKELCEKSKEYYRKRKDEILSKKKERYHNDEEYRKSLLLKQKNFLSNKKNDHNWAENKKQKARLARAKRRKNYEYRKKENEYKRNLRKTNTEFRDRERAKSVAYKKKRRSIDPLFKLKEFTGNLIRNSLKKVNSHKKTKTELILGCTIEYFYQYLESKFKDGMSWEKRSEWHIDHIIPLASARTEDEVLKLNHHTNLQPLWAEENLKLGSKGHTKLK